MNKKLIALAVAGVTLAPAVMAQTANPITLYGRIYATYNTINANGSGVPGGVATPALGRRGVVSDESSNIGFRGIEDLGGGLSAWFQLESSAPPNNVGTGGTFGSRNSAVGLRGGFGSIQLGNWDTPMKSTALLADPTGQLTLADPEGIISNAADGSVGQVFNRRQNNSVQYWTPNINGFSGRALYAPNTGKTATINPSTIGLSANYTGGPIAVAYAYEKHRDQANNTPTAGVTEKAQMLTGSFKFGAFKVGALAQRIDRTAKTNQKVYLVTGQYDIGKHTFWADYGKSKDGLANGAVQPIAKLAGIGYYYNFSKRTTFVADYASIVNNFVSQYTFNGTGTRTFGGVVGKGNDPKGFGLGLRHLF